jgi:hypothetical protein
VLDSYILDLLVPISRIKMELLCYKLRTRRIPNSIPVILLIVVPFVSIYETSIPSIESTSIPRPLLELKSIRCLQEEVYPAVTGFIDLI